MPDGQGWRSWPTRVLSRFGNPIVDGVQLQGHIDAPLSTSATPPGAALQTLDGSDLLQLKFVGRDRPLVSKREFSMQFRLVYFEDALYLREKAATGIPVRVFLAWPETEMWLIKAAAGNQTIWKTARRIGWGLPGVTHAAYPPEVYIDDTAQTVITGGSPTTGQVVVPESSVSQSQGRHWTFITTPAGISGYRLRLRHYPELLLRFSSVSDLIERFGHWSFQATAREFFSWGD